MKLQKTINSEIIKIKQSVLVTTLMFDQGMCMFGAHK